MSATTDARRSIGLWSATAIAAGSMIGAGVFMKPSSMAGQLGSAALLSVVWIAAGLFSLFGALVFAEAGAMFPATGGVYVYFRKMYGDFVAFLYGWSAFSVINTASVAAIAFVCASYAAHFITLPEADPHLVARYSLTIPFIGKLFFLHNIGVKLLAVSLVLFLTLVNHRSLRASNRLQLLSTGVKLLVLGLLVCGIFFSGRGSVANFSGVMPDTLSGSLAGGIVIALTGAFFAYDGWINITFMAGEIKHPQKNIPAALWIGVLICIAVYLLVNQAYLYVMPVQDIAASPLVASDAIARAWSQDAGSIVAALIVICTFGAMNGNIMATCRITYAMGKDKLFASWTGKDDKKFHTPGNALWLHASWTSVLILSGSFDMLADMFVFITWIAYGAGAAGIFILRKKLPNVERPYRVWAHPIVTVLFITFCICFLVLTVYSDVSNYLAGRQPVINSLLGLLITALGIPIYAVMKAKAKGEK